MSEVIKNLEAFISTRFPDKLIEGVTDICMDIRNKAVENCPKDTSLLSTTITFDVEQTLYGVEGAVGTNSEYGIYVHEGTGLYEKNGKGRKQVPWLFTTPDGVTHVTKGQKPQPFLQDAVDEIRPNILNYFKGVLD